LQSGEPLGLVEFNVLDAVHRGALRSRLTARQIGSLREQPAREVVLHDVLHRFEQAGLLSSTRDRAGRLYRLTAAGRAQLRSERRLRGAFGRMLLRSEACAQKRSQHVVDADDAPRKWRRND
jgi:DNA-binding PadR family transcriptional regulator